MNRNSCIVLIGLFIMQMVQLQHDNKNYELEMSFRYGMDDQKNTTSYQFYYIIVSLSSRQKVREEVEEMMSDVTKPALLGERGVE